MHRCRCPSPSISSRTVNRSGLPNGVNERSSATRSQSSSTISEGCSVRAKVHALGHEPDGLTGQQDNGELTQRAREVADRVGLAGSPVGRREVRHA